MCVLLLLGLIKFALFKKIPLLGLWYPYTGMIIQLKELILFLFLLSGTKERISLPWKRWKRLASPTSSRTWPSRSVLNVAALDMNQHVNNFTFIGWVLFFFFFDNVLWVCYCVGYFI
jgi:hypothetical protein